VRPVDNFKLGNADHFRQYNGTSQAARYFGITQRISKERFGGEWFDPAKRGKGQGLMMWRR
jgi:hypothetical protein